MTERGRTTEAGVVAGSVGEAGGLGRGRGRVV